jgi:hypothetical protein
MVLVQNRTGVHLSTVRIFPCRTGNSGPDLLNGGRIENAQDRAFQVPPGCQWVDVTAWTKNTTIIEVEVRDGQTVTATFVHQG